MQRRTQRTRISEEAGLEKDHRPFKVEDFNAFASSARKRARGISRAPKLSKWGVVTWQSIKAKSNFCRYLTRATNATLEALLMRVNMDSQKKQRPSETP